MCVSNEKGSQERWVAVIAANHACFVDDEFGEDETRRRRRRRRKEI